MSELRCALSPIFYYYFFMTKTTKDELLTDTVSHETPETVTKPVKAKTTKTKESLDILPESVQAE